MLSIVGQQVAAQCCARVCSVVTCWSRRITCQVFLHHAKVLYFMYKGTYLSTCCLLISTGFVPLWLFIFLDYLKVWSVFDAISSKYVCHCLSVGCSSCHKILVYKKQKPSIQLTTAKKAETLVWIRFWCKSWCKTRFHFKCEYKYRSVCIWDRAHDLHTIWPV